VIGIASIGWYLPAERRSPTEIAAAYGVAVGAIEQYGLRAQTVAGALDHPTTMAARATAQALLAAKCKPSEVDLLIFCGMTRDYPPPWVAAFGVLQELGATRATGFDLSNRCPGIQDGLWIAAQLVRAGNYRVAVVCTGERFDRVMGPPRPLLQISDISYSAGAAAAVITADAENEIVAYTHFTNEELGLNVQNTPRLGGTRLPVEEGAASPGPGWKNDQTLAQLASLRRFLKEADRRNLDAITKAAGFAGVDFIITAPLDVKAQAAALRELGFDPERQTFFSLPYFGHLGGADSLISLAAAIAQGYAVGPRLVMTSRSVVSANAVAVRGGGPALGIRMIGSPLGQDGGSGATK
jgi:3-oxoacyl-[acyl-carrier-protein] synthase-3